MLCICICASLLFPPLQTLSIYFLSSIIKRTTTTTTTTADNTDNINQIVRRIVHVDTLYATCMLCCLQFISLSLSTLLYSIPFDIQCSIFDA